MARAPRFYVKTSPDQRKYVEATGLTNLQDGTARLYIKSANGHWWGPMTIDNTGDWTTPFTDQGTTLPEGDVVLIDGS